MHEHLSDLYVLYLLISFEANIQLYLNIHRIIEYFFENNWNICYYTDSTPIMAVTVINYLQ